MNLCEFCGNIYIKYRANNKYCSKKCGMERWKIDNPQKLAHIRSASYKKHSASYMLKYYRRRYWVDKIKLKAGCALCGYNKNSKALQFDHTDRDVKLFEIGKSTGRSLVSLFAEIRKCRVLCANCHMIETYTNGSNRPRRRK